MKIASWNVNSLNVRLPHLQQWLQDFAPDVVGLQETKLEDHKFPEDALLAAGYCNVFMGHMSVVGPRPHPLRLNDQYRDIIDKYMVRHFVRPGITGWAQVNGLRGETRTPELMERRVELDVWYLENWSFWLDLRIVVKTVTNMLGKEENAY